MAETIVARWAAAPPVPYNGSTMEREVRYCTTEDGVRIAYCSQGEGPALVACPHLFESFSLEHLFPQLAEIRHLIGQGHQVVRYDMRGTGLSQRDVDDVSHAALVLDIEAVVKAAGVSRFALSGTAFGGARSIEFAVRHPDLVTHLILWGASARFADYTPEDQLRGFAELARTNWSVAVQAFVDLQFRESQEMPDSDLLGFGKLIRESVSGDMAVRILLDMVSSSDVRALLPRVMVPTLVIGRETHLEPGQELAANIPDARLVVLLGGGSSLVLENARPGIDAIHAFLGDKGWTLAEHAPKGSKGGGAVHTILFTDLASSTALTQRLGDAKAQELLRAHNSIVREALKAHGGTEIKHTGDGFMASFASAAGALGCAVAIQRAFNEHNETPAEPIRVRIGLNAGEPIAEDEDLFGAAVIRAARIAALAQAGEILVSNVVQELAEGKVFLFSDRGEIVLRGFDDPVRLFEVRWAETA